MDHFELADKLEKEKNLTDDEFAGILLCEEPEFGEYLAEKARAVREQYYGKDVYLRGLIEFTNYCKNYCRYCGIRRDNKKADRYRLSEEDIMSCSDIGYELGFRTFVLQGGEDSYFTDDRIVSIVSGIKERHPDCAVTLSIGEYEKESYIRYADNLSTDFSEVEKERGLQHILSGEIFAASILNRIPTLYYDGIRCFLYQGICDALGIKCEGITINNRRERLLY